MSNIPSSLDEYKEWLKDEHQLDLTYEEIYYNEVTEKVKRELANSSKWVEFLKKITELHAKYQIKIGEPLLLYPNNPIEISVKPFNSFLDKTFRKNVINNSKFPEKPTRGIKDWILSNNWFDSRSINDIIRTSIVVKFLDGVEYLIKNLKTFFEDKNYECDYSYEDRITGYYAGHLYIIKDFYIPPKSEEFDSKVVKFKIEIQITTQLQEVLKKIIHKFYEKRRIMPYKDQLENRWQWDYESDEFATNYLGHILHYVEGMIADLRNKLRDEKLNGTTTD